MNFSSSGGRGVPYFSNMPPSFKAPGTKDLQMQDRAAADRKRAKAASPRDDERYWAQGHRSAPRETLRDLGCRL